MQTIYVIIGIITYLIGIITGIYSFIKYNKNKQKEEDKISYQIKDINDTLKNHETEDKEIKESINKIEQEQENQNIKIAELHTKMDLICKASNIEENDKTNKEKYER
jgi:uncharacterized membrane-anchored protein YhcB (DUF1043 family)